MLIDIKFPRWWSWLRLQQIISCPSCLEVHSRSLQISVINYTSRWKQLTFFKSPFQSQPKFCEVVFVVPCWNKVIESQKDCNFGFSKFMSKDSHYISFPLRSNLSCIIFKISYLTVEKSFNINTGTFKLCSVCSKVCSGSSRLIGIKESLF